MYFDMSRIGGTIARLRRERNMTQMQLADELDVSFQAVSNWERGRSMPDISKLPELAELFSVTIDELLNGRSVLIEKAAYGKLDEHLDELDKAGKSISVEEAADAAPILQPKQLDKITDRIMEPVAKGDDDNLPDMKELLPFVSQEKADLLFRLQMEKDPDGLNEYAPFVSDELIGDAAVKLEERGRSIEGLLPFMSDRHIIEVARIRSARGESIESLLPFLPDEEINKTALEMERDGRSIGGMLPLVETDTLAEIARMRIRDGREYSEMLPFLSADAVNELAAELSGAGKSFSHMLAFMDNEAVDALAVEHENNGFDIKEILPFVSNKTINEVILNRIRNGRGFRELLPFASDDLIDRLADEAAKK